MPVIQRLAKSKNYITFSYIKNHMMSNEHGLTLDEEEANTLLVRLRERGLIYEEMRLAPDKSKNIHYLMVNYKHPDWRIGA